MINSRFKRFEGTCDGGADTLNAGFMAGGWYVKNDGGVDMTFTIGGEAITVKAGEGFPVKTAAQSPTINGASGGYRVTAYERPEACPDEAERDITTQAIADGQVTAAKLAADAVETAKIKDANVTAAKLAADAVETAKIKDANVTAAKLAADAVETAKIKDANVTLAKLASASVDSSKLVNAVDGTNAPVATKPAAQADYPLETTSATSVNGVVTDRKYEVVGLDLWKTSAASANAGDQLDVQVDGVSILTAVKNLNGTTEHSTITGITIDRTKRIVPQGSTLRLSGTNGGAGGDCAVRGVIRVIPVA